MDLYRLSLTKVAYRSKC